MNTLYTLDLSINPTTFDIWHAYLASAVLILSLLLIAVLVTVLVGMSRYRRQAANMPAAAPEVKIVEKIVEVEKWLEAPAPEPVVLKESTPDAALQLLGLLQQEARFIDFIKEDVSRFSDADIGAAARVVHEGCNKAVNQHFTLAPVRTEAEGSRISLPAGFDAASVRLTGNIVGQAPFTGTLVHKGWQVTEVHLPKLTQAHNANIVAPAEVEL
ncbi:MAG: hypothetical protein CTY24_01060 [Methylobacter sp.]|nr:MAG: hypothetical protein CTY24_01060 [Methylobacter sp.]